MGLISAGVLLLLFWGVYASAPVYAPGRLPEEAGDDHRAGSMCTIRDREGNLVTMVSRRVYPGDGVITAAGRRYVVQRVDGNTATAKFVEMDRDLLAYGELFAKVTLPAATPEWSGRPVAIYHTHTDESYLPSDGRISIPFHGGILQVGGSYTNGLSSQGANVLHDLTPHEPHDNNAYYRSRRTAFRLLKKNPIALFDVHRDGVDDPEFYREVIVNEKVAQIRLVVGRQNPKMASNLDFAKRLMAFANKIYWPVVKEIFIGNGVYNQDLLSTAVLIEAGTYTNRKEEAIKGITLLADAVPVVLGITGPPSLPGAPEYGKPLTDPTARRPGAWWALFWIVIITLAGGGAYVLINAGDLDKAKQDLHHFFRRDLAGMLHPLPEKFPLLRDRLKTALGKRKKL